MFPIETVPAHSLPINTSSGILNVNLSTLAAAFSAAAWPEPSAVLNRLIMIYVNLVHYQMVECMWMRFCFSLLHF